MTEPDDYGEPLNVIISAKSDAAVLVDQEVDGGMRNYFQSIGFSAECFGANLGDDSESANVGDGRGYCEFSSRLRDDTQSASDPRLSVAAAVNQTAILRYDYGNPTIGACQETIDGGNHFRYWVQNGSDANSGAYFLAYVPYATPHLQLVD